MCVPKKHRSIEGVLVDSIYDHLQQTGFCKYALDQQFVKYMIEHDGKLREECKRNEIIQAVEEYATVWKKGWQKTLLRYVLEDFYGFLRGLGSLDSIKKKERYSTALNWLYYYLGVASLDEAQRTGQLK